MMNILPVVATVILLGTFIPLVFSFIATTALQPEHHYLLYAPVTATPNYLYVSKIPTHDDVTATPNGFLSADAFPRHSNNNISICCVIQSLEFPMVASEISEKLSLPLVTTAFTSIDNVDDGDIPQQYQHAIIIEPYTYENIIQNYSIGIVSLSDPPNINGSKKNDSKNHKPRRPGKQMKMNPHVIDFMPPVNSRMGRRTYGDSGQPDLLLKAMRIPLNSIRNDEAETTKQQRPIVVFDTTAGFGQDTLLIAHNMIKNSKKNHNNVGRVHMIERNPIIASLLQDALRRLHLIASTTSVNDKNVNEDHYTDVIFAQQLYQCLSLESNDGFNVLRNINSYNQNDSSSDGNDNVSNNCMKPDIVYLDPMFPTRRKSASVKKNMQILHSLLEEVDGSSCDKNAPQQPSLTTKDEEEARLLQMAYQVARYRVVVKRPIHASSIALSLVTAFGLNNTATTTSIQPSYQIAGTINRWDVYNKQ